MLLKRPELCGGSAAWWMRVKCGVVLEEVRTIGGRKQWFCIIDVETW